MIDDYKTPEDRLKRSGTNDWVGQLQAFILGVVVAMITGMVLGALSVLL